MTESGPTYAPGPQGLGKRISEFVLDAQGALVSGPIPLIEYVGAGRATATALAAGPDGLYFADLYKDFGAATPIDAGANVFRIRYVGVADFSMDAAAGVAPADGRSSTTRPTSRAPRPGTGSSATARSATSAILRTTYDGAGSFDVRLTVTGPAGAAARQKAAAVVVESPAREARPCCQPVAAELPAGPSRPDRMGR